MSYSSFYYLQLKKLQDSEGTSPRKQKKCKTNLNVLNAGTLIKDSSFHCCHSQRKMLIPYSSASPQILELWWGRDEYIYVCVCVCMHTHTHMDIDTEVGFPGRTVVRVYVSVQETQETRFRSWVRRSLRVGNGKNSCDGGGSLAGYSPWVPKSQTDTHIDIDPDTHFLSSSMSWNALLNLSSQCLTPQSLNPQKPVSVWLPQLPACKLVPFFQ